MSLTTVADTLLNPDTSPRAGTVTFIPTRLASNGTGLIPASSSVTATLNGSGAFSVQLTPTSEYDAETYYQLWFKDSVTRAREFIGLYEVPVSSTPQTLSPNAVSDTDAVSRYRFASEVSVLSLTAGVIGSAPVTPAQIGADQNNYNPGASFGNLRLSSDASRTLTGMLNARDGYVMWIWNIGTHDIVFANESSSSTASKRFHTNTGSDITLGANGVAFAMYDGTSSRWRIAKIS